MSCGICYDTLALVLHAKGDDDEAARAQAIAVNLTPDGYDTDEMRQRWYEYSSAAPGTRRPTRSSTSAPLVACSDAGC